MRRFFRPPLLDLSHSSSVKFARIGNLLRSYRPRFLAVHIAISSPNHVTTKQIIKIFADRPETKLKAAPASSHHVVAVRNRHTIGRGQPIQPMEHSDGIGPGQHHHPHAQDPRAQQVAGQAERTPDPGLRLVGEGLRRLGGVSRAESPSNRHVIGVDVGINTLIATSEEPAIGKDWRQISARVRRRPQASASGARSSPATTSSTMPPSNCRGIGSLLSASKT
jgi:hypothetical protein